MESGTQAMMLYDLNRENIVYDIKKKVRGSVEFVIILRKRGG